MTSCPSTNDSRGLSRNPLGHFEALVLMSHGKIPRGGKMKLSEIIESLTHIETNYGDVEVTKVGWVEAEDRWHVYVNYK